MKTSLTELDQIEKYLLKKGDIRERLVTEARILSSPEVKEKAHWQSATYDLVHLYGRRKLLEEIKAIEHQLFHDTKYRSFRDRIRSIFNK